MVIVHVFGKKLLAFGTRCWGVCIPITCVEHLLTHTAEINAYYLYRIASGKHPPSPTRRHLAPTLGQSSYIAPPSLCPDHCGPLPGLVTSKGESKEGEGASTATAGLNLLAALLGAQAKGEGGDDDRGGEGGGAKRRGGQRDSFKINLFPEDPFDAAQAKGGDDGDLEVGLCPYVAPCCSCGRAFGSSKVVRIIRTGLGCCFYLWVDPSPGSYSETTKCDLFSNGGLTSRTADR